MIDITNCNKIIVDTIGKTEKIIEWYQQNKDWLDAEEFRIPIPSALVELPEEDIKFYYEQEGVFVRLHSPNIWYECRLCVDRFHSFYQNLKFFSFHYQPSTSFTLFPMRSPLFLYAEDDCNLSQIMPFHPFDIHSSIRLHTAVSP